VHGDDHAEGFSELSSVSLLGIRIEEFCQSKYSILKANANLCS
jgi:hypothetical protein